MDAFELMHNHTMRDVIDFICRNGKNKNAAKYRFNSLYGSGAFKEKRYWEALVYQLMSKGYLVNINEDGRKCDATVRTPDGIAWSHSKPLSDLKLPAIGQMYPFFRKKGDQAEAAVASTSNACGLSSKLPLVNGVKSNNNFSISIFSKLLHRMRSELARHFHCQPYDICNDSSLNEMAQKQPRNLDELQANHITGFDEETIRKYGPSFVNAISKLKVSQMIQHQRSVHQSFQDIN